MDRQLSLLDALGHEDVAARCDRDAVRDRDAVAGESAGAVLGQRAGMEIAEKLRGLAEQLRVFENISRCPILAITGLLNAGKSSLLATYLSPANRRRVLRGLGNQAGTHRFVLWLPQIWWNEADLLNTLVSFLTNLFGHPPEHLSDDPAQAALQYNGRINPHALLQHASSQMASAPRGDLAPESQLKPQPVEADAEAIDPMSVPLIAYDPGLDDLKIGLVDCPDIQTGFYSGMSALRGISGAELAESRKQHLARVGRLCSAFVVVSKLNSLHDDGLLQILGTLRDAMPGVPRMLAINKIKSRYAPEVVYEQSRGLVERFSLQAVYAAYDFRSSLAHSRIPPLPPKMQLDDSQAGSTPAKLVSGQAPEMPIFFELSPAFSSQSDPRPLPSDDDSPSSPQAGSTAYRYLFDLGQRLDAGTLSRASSRSLTLQFKAAASQAVQWLEANQDARRVQVHDAWQAVAQACYEFMAERDASGRAVGLRLQASPAIMAQMADSLRRTAPMWMRVSLSIDRTARQFQQAVSNSAARFKILNGASQSVTQFTKKFRRGEGAQVVTPERLGNEIRRFDMHDAFQDLNDGRLVSGCETAIKRFADEDKTLLDDSELDAWSRQIWENMSLRDKLWKGTQPLVVLMAPLLAAVLVPIDAGGTAVLVFASTKELLTAAGIAAVMAPIATGGEALSIVQRETPWRQLSDLFSITCDSLGVPRPTTNELPKIPVGNASRHLLACNLPVKFTSNRPAVHQWRLDAEQLRQLLPLIQSL